MTVYRQICGCLLLDCREYYRQYGVESEPKPSNTISLLRVIAPCKNPFHKVGIFDIKTSSTKKTKYKKLSVEDISRIMKALMIKK